jgi:SRP72 RNA-binding domain
LRAQILIAKSKFVFINNSLEEGRGAIELLA